MKRSYLEENAERLMEEAVDVLFKDIGIRMASFIAEIDKDSNDVAAYIEQRLSLLKSLARTDSKARDVLERIRKDTRKLLR